MPVSSQSSSSAPRLLLADRGDALVAEMSAAMRGRFEVVDHLDTDLSRIERLLVAATTFRPRRRAWAERFFKSNLGVRLRSRRARAALVGTQDVADVVFQTHALFATSDARTVLYIDCTHRQSMAHWSAWNPLHGRALEHWLARELEQYQQAAHIFAFYEDTARSLVEDYGVSADRVSVVGVGANIQRLPDTARAQDTRPTILFVGNDFERKGGPELLEAFALVRRRVPEAQLRIAGTPYPDTTRPGVEHLGRIHDRERMSALYREADVFCLVPHFDPLPLALIEAMAHGLPCVVSPVCGIPETVVDGVTALSVHHGPSLVPDLAAALERLLLDPEEAARMGRMGRRRVEDRYQWSHVLDRMTPAIERLAGASRIPEATSEQIEEDGTGRLQDDRHR